MKRLRLLMTADRIGGVWQYATDLAEALVPLGITTVLALLGPSPNAAERRRAEEIPGLLLIDTGLPLDWMAESALPVVRAGETIAALAASEAADVVQLNMPALGAAADFSMPVVAVTHGCVGTWWQAAKTEPLAERYAWHPAMIRDGLTRADVLVAPSAAYGELVRDYYHLSRAPLTVPNGRAPLAPHRARRRDWAFTVGRLWDGVKQARLLDRVAARLAVPFYAAGAIAGPHGERIRLEHLRLLGELAGAGIARALATKPVFVSAATFEPFGLAVLEAAQAGSALVLSDLATFHELWDDAALFVPEQTPSAYQRAIEGLLSDGAERRRLGAAARARAERYTPAATGAAMAKLYRGLLAARPGREAA